MTSPKLDSYKEENDTHKVNDNLQLWAIICLFSEMAFLKQTKHFHY